MKLVQLQVKNFMPYKGMHTLTFPSHDVRNVALVYGDNMRGKTSLMNALRWCFYGEAKDRYGDPIPLHKLVNVDAVAEGDVEMEATVEFTYEGMRFEITRSAKRRPGVSRPTKPEDLIDHVMMRKDGEVALASSIIHQINQIIPEKISRFFLFDGELLQEYETLLADDDPQGTKIKEAIEQALGVPSLTNARADLRIARKTHDRAYQNEAKQHEVSRQFTEKLAQLQQEGDRFEQEASNLEARIGEQRASISALSEEIDREEGRYHQKQSLDQKKARLGEIDRERDAIHQRRLLAAKDVWLDVLRPKIEAALAKSQSTLAGLLREVSEGGGIPVGAYSRSAEAGQCELCDQKLDGIASQRVAGKATEHQHQPSAEKLEAIAQSALRAQGLSGVRFPGSGRALKELQAFEHRLEIEETRTRAEIADLAKVLEGFDSERIARVRRQREVASANIRILEEQLHALGQRIEENAKNKEKCRQLINASPGAKNRRSTRVVRMFDALEKCFARAVTELRDDLKAQIERKATEAFKELTTDSSYKTLRINGNYGLTIVDSKDREVSLRSAGAEQIVALSLIDALNQAGRTRGPVVMDTPFGRLDPRHRNKVLNHLPASATQVVLFVHEGEVSQDVEKVIADRVGVVYSIERVSSSQSRLVRRQQ